MNDISNQLSSEIESKLFKFFGVLASEATLDQVFKSTALTVRDMLLSRRREFDKKQRAAGAKKVYYLCMEFLVGKSLKNNLYNLGIYDEVSAVLQKMGFSIRDLCDYEPDPGLGNGGLGRLAACYMDSLAALSYPAAGFSIRYEYGLFRQCIIDGWQSELPDVWLPRGEVWLMPRGDHPFHVRFDGYVEEEWTENRLKINYKDYNEVEAIAYDMMISSEKSEAVSVLHLWRARDIENFDMNSFSSGDYLRATLENTNAEIISKVLYPADNHYEGKSLRIKQQYFLVSASMQKIVFDHLRLYKTLDNFAEKNAIHINDTHPALCIPELMRIFVDEHGLDWEKAFGLVLGSVAYTNHTVLSEALERWPEELIRQRLPRIYMIIKEIDRRFKADILERFSGNFGMADRLSIISGGNVHMANLCIVGSHSVNGVSALHSDILKNNVFGEFSQAYPGKFTNVTNGITYRRWLCQANPRLTALLDECIGEDYKKDSMRLLDFLKFKDNPYILNRLEQIKDTNKKDFAKYVLKLTGICPNHNSIFSMQVKRLHEYKRQLMNALRLIYIYTELEENPNLDIYPQTHFFASKAAPGYHRAKQIIRLICCLAAEIEKNPSIREKLRVIFLENYSVSMAEILMPAAEISQQISLAGKEASGTGNMKLMINGAVTIGTMDGANVEIRQSVGDDNIFIFGLGAKEVESVWQSGYRPFSYYERNDRLKRAIDRLYKGFAGVSFSEMADYLLRGSHGIADPYMCLADFADYCRAHEQIEAAYRDRARWNRMSLYNIACAGRFSSDRSIKEYAENIWHIKPLT